MTEWGYGLVVLVHGLIAAYLLTYIKKKASDLATKENLEDLKLQLHETTTVVKSTEQHIMSDVWVAQKRWEIKKEFYSNALANFEIILDALKVVENSLKPSENDRPQPSKTSGEKSSTPPTIETQSQPTLFPLISMPAFSDSRDQIFLHVLANHGCWSRGRPFGR